MNEQAPQANHEFNPLDRARQDAGQISAGEQIYNEFMADEETGAVDPQAAEDLALYLENRPSQDEAGRIREPGTAKFANADKYFDDQRQTHYDHSQSSYYEQSDAELQEKLDDALTRYDLTTARNIEDIFTETEAESAKNVRESAADKGMLELAREVAYARADGKRVIESAVTDVLIDKMADHAEKLSRKDLDAGNPEDALIDRINRYIDKIEAHDRRAQDRPAAPEEPEVPPKPVLPENPSIKEVDDYVMAGLTPGQRKRIEDKMDEKPEAIEEKNELSPEEMIIDAEENDEDVEHEDMPEEINGGGEYEDVPEEELKDAERQARDELLAELDAQDDAAPQDEAVSNREKEARKNKILEEYGFPSDHIRLMNDEFKREKGSIDILEAEDHEGGVRFMLLINTPDEHGVNGLLMRLTGPELLQFMKKSDNNLLSHRRPRGNKSDAVTHNEHLEEIGAERRREMRRPDRTQKLKFHEKLMIAAGNIRNPDREKMSRRKKLMIAAGALAVGLASVKLGVNPFEGNEDAVRDQASNLDVPKNPKNLNEIGDLVPAAAAKPAAKAAESANDMISLDVKPGEGYTHVIDRYADSQGIDLNGSESYAAYQDMEARNALDAANDYTMANGDQGISAANINLDQSDLDKSIKRANRR